MGKYTTVSRRGHVGSEAHEVIRLLSSTAGFTSINPHLSADPKLVIQPSGPPAGVGSGFAFRGKDGRGTQFVSAITDTKIVHDIDMGAMGRSQQQILVRPADDGGSDVEWSITLNAGNNVALRIFGLVADRVLGPTLETGIRNLATYSAPTHVIETPRLSA